MELIPAKSILSPWHEAGWFAGNYGMNLYKGCCHGCIYCDSRSECYGIQDFDRVRGKKDALDILGRELKARRKKGVILTGSMCDSYNPFEKELKNTRRALEMMDQNSFGTAIMTKSALVTRDVDVLSSIARHSPAAVSLTITAAEDGLCRKIERHVAVSSQRFSALEELSKKGINCGVLLMPLLPFINDTAENVEAIVNRAADCGAKWVFAFPGMGVTLRQNQRVYFYDRLQEDFPGLKETYIRVFGGKYECASPRHAELWEHFKECCRQKKMLYDMDAINDFLLSPYRTEQLSFY